jgi:peptidoglycan-associated lipoprotein
MKLLPMSLLVAAVALSACTNPNRFGANDDALANPVPSGTVQPSNGIVPGSANDPTSTAYFNQTVGDRVLFEVDQATLTAAGRATLDGQAGWLATNLALGARRANAAREYLLSKGVPAARLRVVSYGKERPIEICSNEACYAKNRRAVTVLAGGQTS